MAFYRVDAHKTPSMFDLYRAVDQKESALAFFFDFVPHDRLLLKLSTLLMSWLIRWIAKYLSNRQQRSKIGDFSTDWKNVEAGVVQGPILFILYISDINKYLPTKRFVEKYADDIISYIIGHDVSSTLPQTVVDSVQKWCDDNLMRLNASKCKILHFPAKHTEQPPIVKLSETALEIVPSYKYLGIDITDSLDSSVHWLSISSTIRQNIALLKLLKSSGLETSILVTVFKSLVLSHLSYGSVLLDSCTQDEKSDMQIIQNRMLRIIGIIKEVALTQYNILSVSDFIENMCIKQVTKLLHSQEPRSQLVFEILAALTPTSRSTCQERAPRSSTTRLSSRHFDAWATRASIVAHKPDHARRQLTTGRAQLHRCVRLVKSRSSGSQCTNAKSRSSE